MRLKKKKNINSKIFNTKFEIENNNTNKSYSAIPVKNTELNSKINVNLNKLNFKYLNTGNLTNKSKININEEGNSPPDLKNNIILKNFNTTEYNKIKFNPIKNNLKSYNSNITNNNNINYDNLSKFSEFEVNKIIDTEENITNNPENDNESEEIQYNQTYRGKDDNLLGNQEIIINNQNFTLNNNSFTQRSNYNSNKNPDQINSSNNLFDNRLLTLKPNEYLETQDNKSNLTRITYDSYNIPQNDNSDNLFLKHKNRNYSFLSSKVNEFYWSNIENDNKNKKQEKNKQEKNNNSKENSLKEIFMEQGSELAVFFSSKNDINFNYSESKFYDNNSNIFSVMNTNNSNLNNISNGNLVQESLNNEEEQEIINSHRMIKKRKIKYFSKSNKSLKEEFKQISLDIQNLDDSIKKTENDLDYMLDINKNSNVINFFYFFSTNLFYFFLIISKAYNKN